MKKTAKSLFSMLGTVPDGVKSKILTASDAYTIILPRVHDGVKSHRLTASEIMNNIYREMVTASHTGRQE